MIESIALYLGGMGFFFSGTTGLSANLRQLTGQRFRTLLSRATNHPVRAGLLGLAAGAVSQSTSVVAFVLSGMVSTGLLRLSRALVVLACANIGTAALVFAAAIDLHLPVLFLIGICGLILGFNVFGGWKAGIRTVLSIGLVFFGLDLMKEAFGAVSEGHGLRQIATYFDHWPNVAFLLGALMRTAIPSSSATAAITVTINKGGMLGEFPAMMAIAGIGIGAAISTMLLSSSFRGIPRQIAYYQAATTVVGGVLLAGLLLLEHLAGIPLLLTLSNTITSSNSAHLAIAYLTLNLIIASVCLAGLRWAPAWLARISPPTIEEDLSRPRYLDAEALQSPETAPDLVALEQLRAMAVLGQYLDAVRTGDGKIIKSLHNAAVALGEEIVRFLQALVEQPIGASVAAHVISLQRKEEILRSLEENVFLFAATLEHRGQDEMCGRMVEALDTIILTATDALSLGDPADIELLVRITDDRGSTMERMRSRFQRENPDHVGDISALNYATTLFERNVWLLRQLALWLRENAANLQPSASFVS
jgi:phosphate:Na+ symporter